MFMITLSDLKKDKEVKAIMDVSALQMDALGYTEHSERHCRIVAKTAGEIMAAIGATAEEINSAELAGYLHDLGNSVNRVEHAQSGALLAYRILTRLGMEYATAAEIMMAIGNHDEKHGTPVSRISAALIIADKADVHKSRVRQAVRLIPPKEADIHDRVNLAAESSKIITDESTIALKIQINTEICSVSDYFEIYFNRMQMCRRAADFLDRKFSLEINGVSLM
ncbi:MAG: HD domain-containing protein [Clostridia bacterium]|nr:HD domain-containing protein [Clostridia bacterium]MBQ5802129.1 HD domain-containing protein [Clostridia bacterium]